MAIVSKDQAIISARNLPKQEQIKAQNTDFVRDAVGLALVYLLCWFTVYLDMSMAIRIIMALALIVIQLSSYYRACIILLMVLFIPFFGKLFNEAISGFSLPRLLFAIFFIQSLAQGKIRNLQIDPRLLFLLILSFVTLQFSSGFQILFRHMPLSGEGEPAGLKNIVAMVYDNIAILFFLYFVFTRLPFEKLSALVSLFILIAIFEAASLLMIALQNTDKIFGVDAKDLDRNVLWLNPYFGHKNDWSIMFVFIFLLSIVRNMYVKENGFLHYLVLIFVMPAIAISLSRQAYVWLILVLVLVAWLKKDFRFIGYLTALILLFAVFKPDFIYIRIQSMLEVDNLEEFQELNRKVSDLAIEQAINNFTIIPRMFYQNWEYNWSEGFWNGFLHQQGIIGLFFTFFLYYYIYSRYQHFSKIKNGGLHYYGIILMAAIVLMFFANFNRRHTHFMHYNGFIGQIGFLIMYLILYAELILYALRKHKTELHLLK